MSSTSKEDSPILPKLFARLSHDSKANFRRIRSVFDMLALDIEFDDTQMELVKMIGDIAERGEYEIDGLNYFAQQIDVSDVVCELVFSDVLKSVANEYEHVAVIAVDDLDFTISFNPQALKSILVEVFGNAQKFCPETASPELKIASSVEPTTGVRTIRFSAVSIGVGGYGLEHLWLPYARDSNVADIDGYGVGLTIVSYLVSQNGGAISLEYDDESGFSVNWTLAHPVPTGLEQAA